MAGITQTQAVLEYLQNHGSLTSMEAIELFGATRLADIIFRLRKQGYIIVTVEHETTNRFGQSTRYAEYKYEGILLEI